MMLRAGSAWRDKLDQDDSDDDPLLFRKQLAKAKAAPKASAGRDSSDSDSEESDIRKWRNSSLR